MPRLIGIGLLLVFAQLPTAQAVVVNWSTLSWSPGITNNSYDVDPGVAGNDVTFAITGNTNRFVNALFTSTPTPAITSNLLGGNPSGHMSLQLALDFQVNTEAVTVTINFSNLYLLGVANVSFTLFDVDFANSGGSNQYQDLINTIHATSITGTTIAPTITGSANNTVAGSGINQTVTGNASTADSSGAANTTISFNTTNIRSVTFTYTSTSAFSNPTYQHIALDNITYSTVPEAGTWWSGLFCGGLVVGSTAWRHRKRKSNTK